MKMYSYSTYRTIPKANLSVLYSHMHGSIRSEKPTQYATGTSSHECQQQLNVGHNIYFTNETSKMSFVGISRFYRFNKFCTMIYITFTAT